MSGETFPPRFMRINQACFYLAVNRNYFNRYIRPILTEIEVGEVGVRFDRLELDDWAEDHKSRNGHHAESGDLTCKVSKQVASSYDEESGTSRKQSKDMAYLEKALAKVKSKKQKGTSIAA